MTISNPTTYETHRGEDYLAVFLPREKMPDTLVFQIKYPTKDDELRVAYIVKTVNNYKKLLKTLSIIANLQTTHEAPTCVGDDMNRLFDSLVSEARITIAEAERAES